MDESTWNSIKSGDLSALTTYQAGIMQASTHRSLQKHCDDILRPYGISKMQWLIIGVLLDSGDKGVRLSDLAESLGTNLPFMTNSVNKLEDKGVVVRKDNKKDSRSKLVFLDREFALQCAEIEETLRNGLRKSVYKNIDPAEFRVYMKVLFQLSEVGNDSK